MHYNFRLPGGFLRPLFLIFNSFLYPTEKIDLRGYKQLISKFHSVINWIYNYHWPITKKKNVPAASYQSLVTSKCSDSDSQSESEHY
jgi:hypothetical protein